jgi:hypothetical protein
VFQWDVCVARHHAFRIVEWVCWLEFDIHIGASCRDFFEPGDFNSGFFDSAITLFHRFLWRLQGHMSDYTLLG